MAICKADGGDALCGDFVDLLVFGEVKKFQWFAVGLAKSSEVMVCQKMQKPLQNYF
jgi:hypothetical protein